MVRLTVVGTYVVNENPRNTKIGRKLAITRTRFEVKKLKIKVTRPINAETESESPTNFKLSKRC